MRTGRIHAAQLSRSPRLQRVLAFLRERAGEGATTMEIIRQANVCAVNTIIQELRENGLLIDGEWVPAGDAMAYRYRLVEVAQRNLF